MSGISHVCGRRVGIGRERLAYGDVLGAGLQQAVVTHRRQGFQQRDEVIGRDALRLIAGAGSVATEFYSPQICQSGYKILSKIC